MDCEHYKRGDKCNLPDNPPPHFVSFTFADFLQADSANVTCVCRSTGLWPRPVRGMLLAFTAGIDEEKIKTRVSTAGWLLAGCYFYCRFSIMYVHTLSLALASIAAVHASIEDPAILPTPPMGFNNWARFECNLNESLFVETADAMVSKGLLAAGYNRINIDDCWLQHTRAPNGSLQWNTTLFPQGLIWLGEYVKSKGFFFGIYEDAGNATCGGYPGSRGHEALDAQTFVSWGIDYLKLDGCNVLPDDESTYQELYGHWHDVLTNLTHPLIFSESAPAYFSATDNNTDWYTVMDWVPLYGELARHSTDIAVYGLYEPSHYWASVMVVSRAVDQVDGKTC